MASVLVLMSGSNTGGLSNASREALGVASKLAESLTADIAVAVYEASAEVIAELGERGCSRVYTFAAGGSNSDLLAFYAKAIAESGAQTVIASRGPDLLQVIPRLAARTGGGCVMQATAVEVSGADIVATAAIYGGAARAEYRFRGDGPRIIALSPVSAEAPPRQAGRTAEVVELHFEADNRVRVVKPAQPSDEARLEDARVVVSGGRGIRAAGNYALVRELAAALGGLPGASRAIVDDSWASPAEQVGLTGRTVTPDLYVALGISGASQHMAGCANSRVLVAVNIDPDAPIFRYATYGIVGDCLEVLPEFIAQGKSASAK